MSRVRKLLLRFTKWLEKRMVNHPDFDRQDPEWIAMQNEYIAVQRRLKRGIDRD